MITTKMKVLDVLESFEEEIYSYYPKLLNKSIANINIYIREIKDKLFGLKTEIAKGLFPAKYPKRIIIYSFDELSLDILIRNSFEPKNVFANRYVELCQYIDMNKCIVDAEFWLQKWIEIKEILSDRLNNFSKVEWKNIPDKNTPVTINTLLPEVAPETKTDITCHLKKPESGELKELCSKYASDLKLERGITVSKENIKIIFENIINHSKVETTQNSVSSTLRKLGFCKKNS